MSSDLFLSHRQHFFSSNEHLAGCITAIIGYSLILNGNIGWSWYTALIFFYGIGWLVTAKTIPSPPNLKCTLDVDKETAPNTGTDLPTPVPIVALLLPEPSTPETVKQHNKKNSQFIDDFLKLKLAHELDLPYTAIKILNEIHQVLLMLYQQTEQRSDVFYIEINNTQKIVYQYLQPTIENYLKVPRYYAAHRVIQDEKTAKDLLIEQLSLLKEELYTLLDNILADNLVGLTLHAEFLKQKLKPYQFFKTHIED